MAEPRILALALAASLAAIGGCRTVGTFDARGRGSLAASVIVGWSEPSRLAAAQALERYGPPDAIAPGALGWRDKSPWLRIVVWDAAGNRAAGNLEETVAYRVPEAKRQGLADFARGVRVSEDGSELSARSSDESLNFLALNLANDIARGLKDPEQARKSYDRIVELALAGKSSPYMRELMFAPRR